MTIPTNPAVQHDRGLVLAGVCVVVLMVLSLWIYGRMARSITAATDSIDQWTQCDVLASQIQTLRTQPSMADDRVMQDSDMTRRIAQAAAKSSFNTQKIVSTTYPDAHRIGRTPYLEKPTELQIRKVTLKQTLDLLYALTGGGSQLSVTQLQFTTPHEESDRQLWTVMTTVSYLIYEPPTKNTGS